MLRDDGEVKVFLIQHRYSNHPKDSWYESALPSFFFGTFSYEGRKGKIADYHRSLIAKTNECWQENGIHGFLNLEDALACRDALSAVIAERERERKDVRFRVVHRLIQQDTVVIE